MKQQSVIFLVVKVAGVANILLRLPACLLGGNDEIQLEASENKNVVFYYSSSWIQVRSPTCLAWVHGPSSVPPLPHPSSWAGAQEARVALPWSLSPSTGTPGCNSTAGETHLQWTDFLLRDISIYTT